MIFRLLPILLLLVLGLGCRPNNLTRCNVDGDCNARSICTLGVCQPGARPLDGGIRQPDASAPDGPRADAVSQPDASADVASVDASLPDVPPPDVPLPDVEVLPDVDLVAPDVAVPPVRIRLPFDANFDIDDQGAGCILSQDDSGILLQSRADGDACTCITQLFLDGTRDRVAVHFPADPTNAYGHVVAFGNLPFAHSVSAEIRSGVLVWNTRAVGGTNGRVAIPADVVVVGIGLAADGPRIAFTALTESGFYQYHEEILTDGADLALSQIYITSYSGDPANQLEARFLSIEYTNSLPP